MQSIVDLTKEDKSQANPDTMKNFNRIVQQQKSGEIHYLMSVHVLSVFLTFFLNIKKYLISYNYPE